MRTRLLRQREFSTRRPSVQSLWLGPETGHNAQRPVSRPSHRARPQEFSATEWLDLDLDRERWGIERVFQHVTEVCGLKGLIGETPPATIFQFAACLLLDNVLQTITR